MSNGVQKQEEDWMTKKWRPMMAVVYMAINLFDFIIGPILYNLLQYWNPGQAIGMWSPLTLQGGGLVHIAFGAILGISAFTRGQEKIQAIKAGQGGGQDPTPQAPVMMAMPQQQYQQPAYQAPQPSYAPPATPSFDSMADPAAVSAARTTPTRKIS